MSTVGHLRSAREGALRKSKNLQAQAIQDQVMKDLVVEDQEIEFCCCLLGGRTGDQARGVRPRACFLWVEVFDPVSASRRKLRGFHFGKLSDLSATKF